jgi:predicted nucleic acid-binding protein
MIILDTNVVAEMMKASPAQEVVDWLNAQDSAVLYLTTITLAEVGYGLQILPPGRRRLLLEQSFERVVSAAFSGRILAFDENAARSYGEVMGTRKAIGRPLGTLDGQIAAIARAQGSAVATRNVKDFIDCGLVVFNPFESS